MDAREQQLCAWLKTLPGFGEFGITPASGDASFRRYFRITAGADSWIAMDAPPDKEDTQPFVAITRRLQAGGLSVPHCFHADEQSGFLLLTDLGTELYLDRLCSETADELYGDALAALLRMQGLPADGLPSYDEQLLLREMELFREWFLERHLGAQLTREQHATLDHIFTQLVSSALDQPVVFVHRDYHSRNLIVVPAGTKIDNPGILDYQDAVCGPITYDLVSLLRDCYVDWPQARVEDWALGYRDRAAEAGIVGEIGDSLWLHWFDFMGVQRHLKAIGIFSRLNHRDGKVGYLRDIPRTLAYVQGAASRHDSIGALCELLLDLNVRERMASLCEQ